MSPGGRVSQVVCKWRHKPLFAGVMEGYTRAEEIGKRLESWAMARVTLGVFDCEGVLSVAGGGSRGEEVEKVVVG
jgi:hypothetical protein